MNKDKIINLIVYLFQGLEIDVVDKIYIQFPHRWWSEDCDGFSFLHSTQNKPDHVTKEVSLMDE